MSNQNGRGATALLLVAASIQMGQAAEPGLLRTTHPLDEPRGYCLDIPGPAETARVDDPLQVHTCKYGANLIDQTFTRAADGHGIMLPSYERCLAADALEPGAALYASACTDAPTQRWRFEWGRLSPESRLDLCASLAGGAGEIAGTPPLITPVYRRRDVALERCDDAFAARQTLRFSPTDERRSSTANVLRSGWPADVAAEIAAFGLEFDGRIAGETARIVGPVPTVYSADEIEVHENLAYGSHERQVLDIHTATMRNSGELVPVIVVFHGGGLVGGNKQSTAAAANYFASLGYVGAKSNYRLAPDYAWPEGARDVGNAVTWLKDNVADYGGDPEQIFVMGLSSGSLHAATYVFRPELMPAGTARPRGAILMSGPYTFDFDNPSSGERAYFGEDASDYASRVVVGNVSNVDTPVLFTTAEWDAPRYTWAFSQLLREIVVEHGVMPRYAQSLGHNHSSQLMSIGTADTNVSAQIVDFVERTVAGSY
jgi:acetyl esterase/lipase